MANKLKTKLKSGVTSIHLAPADRATLAKAAKKVKNPKTGEKGLPLTVFIRQAALRRAYAVNAGNVSEA